MANERIDVIASQVISLRECKSKFELESMNLKDNDSDKLDLSKNMFNAVKSALKKSEKDLHTYIKQCARQFINPSWYDYDFSYEAAVEKTSILYARLGSYLADSLGDSAASYDVELSYPFNINYYKVPVGNIKVNADIIIRREGYVEAICLETGMPTVSSAARKPENLPENDLMISIIYAAMRVMYPEDTIKVSLYHLVSKDDKGTTYVEYERKQGKNIASAVFDTCVDALVHLKNVMCIRVKKDCDNCFDRDCCQFSCFKEEQNDTEESNISESKPPVIKRTETQEMIVNHMDGPLLVEAAPGTGKTASLVGRLEKMISNGIDPKNILMITFTKKAKAEIENRVCRILDGGAEMPDINTFNGCGYNILRDNPNILGELKLAEDYDKKSLVEQALKDCYSEGIVIQNVNYGNMNGKYGLVQTCFDYFNKISELGEEVFRTNYAKKDTAGILAVYNKYQYLFENGNYIDYNEQISLVNKLFKEHPDVLNSYQDKWRYIMVDEFQDVSIEQFNLIYALSYKYQNIVCVGDCDQAIYGFRGGTNAFALEFKEYFPDAQIIYMVDNFRCTDNIVDVANHLIKNNKDRFDKTITAHKKGRVVALVKGIGYESRIYNELTKSYKPGEIAVISTTNKQLSHFGEIISPDGSLKPKDYIINDSVFLAIKDILELRENGFNNDRVLYRVLTFAGATRDDFLKIRRKADEPMYMSADLPDMTLKPLDENHDTPLWNAGLKVKAAMREFVYAGDIERILSGVCNDIFGFSSHPVINYLVEKCDERCITHMKQLYELMQAMVLYEDSARVGYSDNEERLNLVTAHDSKGKEFPCVIVYGAENFKNTEEGRRLLYVAITRAIDRLVIIEGFNAPDSMVNEFADRCRILKGGVANG